LGERPLIAISHSWLPLFGLALQDMHKLMNKDKIILRFTARMTPGQSAVSHADAGEQTQIDSILARDSNGF
jgi:hypothetical protein